MIIRAVPENILSMKLTLFSTWSQIVTFSVKLDSLSSTSHSSGLPEDTGLTSPETKSPIPASDVSRRSSVV